MSSEWRKIQLGKVASTLNGAGIKQSHFAETGVPLARVSNFVSSTIDLSDCIYVETEHAKRWQKHRLNEGDVIVATVGSWPPNWSSVVGKVVRVPASATGALQNQNTCRIIANKELADQQFLFYLLSTSEFIHFAANTAAGSANQARLSVSSLEKFSFSLPPLIEQGRIASILGALDTRITLLRETNKTLESIAQAMFKSWFVDFDPVRAKMEGRQPEGMDEETAALFPDSFQDSELGSIPIGWQVTPIGDAVGTVGGATPDTKNPDFWDPPVHCWTTPKDLSGVASPILLDTERKLSPEGIKKVSSGLLPEGTLLLSSRAPIGYLALTQIPLAINQGYIAMLPGGVLPPLYLLFWCKQNMEYIKGRANGSTFMEISKKAFRPIPILVPAPELIQRFADTANALFGRLSENERQAQTLSVLRDTLLPRLISGQLRLPEAPEQVENALS